MAKKKYDLVTELYAEAVREVTSKPENWMAFLRSACRNYRLPFDEQLLIHVQRPDATAVLEMEDWNRKFGRWVKRDSKGIAVIDKNAGAMRLKYYFDVSDTKEGRYHRLVRPVSLWTVQEKHRQEVQETLANAFGVEGELAGFAATVQEVANNAASDNLADYMGNILSSRENSFLEEMDEYNVEVRVRQLLSNSVAFMVMVRCGIDTEMYLNTEDFQGITGFNTPQLANLFGVATSDVSEMALSQIADTVRKLQLEEKKNNRTFAGKETNAYNERTNTNSERSAEYESNRIQSEGRLSFAKHYRTGRTRETPWEVRLAPKGLPEEREVRDIHHPANAGATERTSGRDAGSGAKQDGADRIGDGARTRSDRGTESKRPNDVGGNDEQHSAGSGGDRDAGTGLRLGWYDRSNEDKSLPFFGNDQDIKSMFLSTPHLKASKEDIKAFYDRHESKKERTEYIKEIFNDEYTEVTLENGKRIGYKTYENVLHLWVGSYPSRTEQGFYDWEVISEYFESMRLLGELRDKVKPLQTVQGQLTLMEDLAEEKASAFYFSQEIIDYMLAKGSLMEDGKYRIYSYFMQGHTAKEREDFLKNEYGTGGRSTVIIGTGIGEDHDGKGIKLHRGYEEDSPKLFLKWNKVVKRIDELIKAGRYLSKREMEYLPEYEKHVLSTEIYHFYSNQPEEVMRPYPYGVYYSDGIKVIRPQLDDSKRVEEILKSMEEVLSNTADFARNYQSMQNAFRDLTDYRDGKYSLFTPLSDKPTEQTHSLTEPIPEKSREEILAEKLNSFSRNYDTYGYRDNMENGQTQEEVIAQIKEQLLSPQNVTGIYDFLITANAEMETDDELYGELQELLQEIVELPAMNPPYDLQVGTVVYIGIKEYQIDFLSDEKAVLRDMEYPLFTVDMPREELERKVRENPANDRLKTNRSLAESPAENTNVRTTPAQPRAELTKEKEEADRQAEIIKETVTPARFEVQETSDAYEEPFAVFDREKGEYYALDGIVQMFLDEKEALRLTQSLNGKEPGTDEIGTAEITEADIAIGTELMMDGRSFSVDSVDIAQGTVSLKDVTFQSNTGFPIFRNESVQLVYDLLKEQKVKKTQTDLVPAWEQKKPRVKARGFDLHPEIPQSLRNQYRITNDELGYGTAKEKFRANIAAIQLLKECESEDRYATLDEQEILSRYVGWGGLSDAFDETKSSWSNEYLELKTVLNEEEYTAARQSTLTAFYTPPVVIKAMYQALENMGLKAGNILEPSCGVGNFIGMKPESLSECKVYGVEIDPVSGRIAGQLYQKSNIAVQGYEEADLPDSFFDVAIGNVPFGQFRVSDKRYDKHNFLIHDYFFAKTLDKVRPGGVIAFITSSGTMDKKNSSLRKYIAQRAELLGAIRLPNDTFQKNARTEVTSDILFLQKRDRLIETEPEWLYLDTDENGITQNRYFVGHPEMVLGKMTMESGPFGMTSTCKPYEDRELNSLLSEAVENIQAEIADYETEKLVEEEDNSIPADPSVPNFSYTIYDGKIYYRENSRMKPMELSVTGANRVRGMVSIRDCVRELIAYQTEGYADAVIEEQQKKLNELYDVFRSKYGLLNARANSLVFSDDNSYPLLCSLEILAEDGTLERKADMFTKRTIKPHEAVTKVNTASEALSLSLAEKARVDMEYMCLLTGKSAEDIEKELTGVIFRLPNVPGEAPKFVSEDEYLSGNVRQKLKEAKLAAKASEVYKTNVEALEKIQPKDLTASEINIRLGATWIPTDDIADFMFELLETPNYHRWNIKVHFSRYTGEWQIEGKSIDKANVKANNAYGTHRASAYRIIEDSLNLRDTRIYDYVEDDKGKKKQILNKKETSIAQGKQDLIKQAFQDWIWKEPERRQRLTDYYNENFNAIRPREYDGSHLKFYGMNPEIKLRQHQKNGAARIIYGGNTLLAYVVGAGKTYTMVAAAMESKRLGLCNKSMIVVPNHIIEQFAAEWLQLYPAANLLVATKKDFETKNRKKFCARIATSDIDAVIIGHSQFEKIPLSVDRQRQTLERELDEITDGIIEAKSQQGQRFTVKQLEKSKKSILAKLKKLNDQSRKDNVVTFEELGIDRLFVDEADGYKNLFLYTKMRNVGGIAQTEAQKSSDMFMKCRYLDEITGGRGVIFATGTPVSNSMVELYTMQRYLQYNTLVMNRLQHFDAWASTFGETVTAIELAPEGTGYRLKTRFARFYNLPELMTMFREVADIQTADMLNLPVPEAEYRVVTVKPSEMQKQMVEELGNRAERVRNNMIDPRQDNMLLITNDGRKLALDQRLANEMLPDEAESKVNACVEEVYRFWEEGREEKLTQLLFCDLSTPKNDGTFSVYNDVRDKLIARGIPPEEIAFIHDANTETKKKDLFSKVRRGAVRVLMGSTFKMGAGTNVQDLIIASHDLDCPWRPRDLEQRAGRTIRQGNKNEKVDIIRYVTEGTFDAYLYQVIENKQKFISQIMTSKNPARTVEDIDEVALSYAEIKALAAGNPHVKEKMDLDIQVSKLQLLKQSFLSQKYEMEDKVKRYFPVEIKKMEQRIACCQTDIEQIKEHMPPDCETFPPMQIGETVYTEKKEAGQAVIEACKAMTSPDGVPLGNYRGLSMELSYDSFGKNFIVTLKGEEKYHVTLGDDIFGNITRIDNEVEKIPDRVERCKEQLENLKNQMETAKAEAVKEFPQEKELAEKTARLGELNAMLDIGKSDLVLLDDVVDAAELKLAKKETDRER